jgi:hypothetical protein
MKLSERMKQRETAGDETPSFGTVSTRAAETAEAKGVLSADPVSQLKRRAQEALIRRMGPALWEPTSSATQLDAEVVRELSVVLKEEKIPLNDAEREATRRRDRRPGARLRTDRAVPPRPDDQRGDGQRRLDGV